MQAVTNATSMVHYACEACDMTATMVVTPAGTRAWWQHMRTHEANEQQYRAYQWTVMALPF